ncbi:MAG TPA: OmpA/MotB family protein [Candidatus Brocadiia bacterium]|nr:OmpA family protein [Planctomycetota bacterium]MDO8092220.1 OmpA family protein [Candidatus Brocadiales bacterium]
MRKKRKIFVSEKCPTMDMLSFCGIMTILLAFFIVLSSMAQEKKTELLKAAQRSFIDRLDSHGLSRILPWKKGVVSIERIGIENEFPTVREEPRDDGALCTMIEKELKIDYLRSGSKVVIPTPIVFEPNKAELSLTNEDFLNKLIKLVRNRSCKIIIEGYVDSSFVPSARYPSSWELSAAYAASVARYLHENGKISFNRMSVVGYGSFRPIGEIDTPERRGGNNRVNIVVSNDT